MCLIGSHIEKLDGLDCNAFIDALMRLSQVGATRQQGYGSLSVLDLPKVQCIASDEQIMRNSKIILN